MVTEAGEKMFEPFGATVTITVAASAAFRQRANKARKPLIRSLKIRIFLN
jgi:hypothetical protein